MSFEEMAALAAAVFILAMKPGPGMMMVMSRTISGGMGACLTFLLGFLFITFLYLAVALAGFHFIDLDVVFFIDPD